MYDLGNDGTSLKRSCVEVSGCHGKEPPRADHPMAISQMCALATLDGMVACEVVDNTKLKTGCSLVSFSNFQ